MKESQRTQGGEGRRVVFLPGDDPNAARRELQRLFLNGGEPIEENRNPEDPTSDRDVPRSYLSWAK